MLVDRLYRAVLQGRRCLAGKCVVTPWALGSSAQESEQADLGLLGSKAGRGDGFHLWICALFQCNWCFCLFYAEVMLVALTTRADRPSLQLTGGHPGIICSGELHHPLVEAGMERPWLAWGLGRRERQVA